jgi:hypothetical protein
MRKLLCLAAVCAGAAGAQSLSIGVLGGVPFTDAVNSVQTNTVSTIYKSANFVIGPSFQVNLPASLRFEVDALYRPVEFQYTLPFTAINSSASQWQFPFLLQYRVKIPVVKPFLESGFSFDHLSNVSAAGRAITSGLGQLVQQSHASVVLGGGVEVKVPFVRVSGELRYSRQWSEDFRQISNLNQAEFLVGVHF